MRLAFLGLLLAASLAATAGPRELIAACAARAPEKAAGLKALEEACPGLGAALDELDVGPLLSEATAASISAVKLADSVALATDAHAAVVTAPRTVSLPTVLDSLAAPSVAPSWWERFKDWLRARFAAQQKQDGAPPGWLAKLFSRLSGHASVFEVLLNVLKLLIVGAAIAIVLNELRAYGVFGRRAQRGGRRSGAPVPGLGPRTVTLADVEAAPAARRAALLFDLLVSTLVQHGRITAARIRTHRELSREQAFADPADESRFARLASAAEQQLFAATPVPEDRLGAVLADGTALYASVVNPAGAGR